MFLKLLPLLLISFLVSSSKEFHVRITMAHGYRKTIIQSLCGYVYLSRPKQPQRSYQPDPMFKCHTNIVFFYHFSQCTLIILFEVYWYENTLNAHAYYIYACLVLSAKSAFHISLCTFIFFLKAGSPAHFCWEDWGKSWLNLECKKKKKKL